jgi:hypothetical protein
VARVVGGGHPADGGRVGAGEVFVARDARPILGGPGAVVPQAAVKDVVRALGPDPCAPIRR